MLKKNYIKRMMFAALFAALTAAVSPIKIPLGFTPVPITLQTLMVLLSGALLGANLGALSQILYLIVGAIGLPVFAGGGSGLGALLGPSGGYLFSYPIAAYAVGFMAEKKTINRLLKYLSVVIISGLVALAYIDLSLGFGIIKIWNSTTKSYVPIVSMLSSSQRFAWIGISLTAILVLVFALIYLQKKKNLSTNTIFGMFAGTLIIYILGSIQGKMVTSLPWAAIFVGWVLPFIIGDTVKLLIAAYISNKFDIKKYLK